MLIIHFNYLNLEHFVAPNVPTDFKVTVFKP